MSGPPDKDPRSARGDHRLPPGEPGLPGTGGETSGDFGLERAVERLEAELRSEPLAGPSAVDIMDSAAIRGVPAAPGASGRVVGAPPVLAPERPGGLGVPFDASASDRALPAGQTQVGMRGPVTPPPTLPSDRPGVRGPAYADSALLRAAQAAAAARESSSALPSSAGSTATGPVVRWQPSDASQSAITGGATPASDAKPQPAPAHDERPWSAERTVVGRSPSPNPPPPRPWLLYAIAGVLLGAIGVALLMRSLG